MKKNVLLNAELSYAIASLGHTDRLVVCDAGLPIPQGPKRIDLALRAGIPSLMQTLQTTTAEMQVEAAILAKEIKAKNPALHKQVLAHLKQLEKSQKNKIQISYVSHVEFKKQTKSAQAIVRSGECSPYANVILCSGVVF